MWLQEDSGHEKEFDTSTWSNVNTRHVKTRAAQAQKRRASLCVLPISSLMTWSALVMQLRELLVNTCTSRPAHTHAHTDTHTISRVPLISTPVNSATTHTFTLQFEHIHTQKKLPTKLFGFIRADSSKKGGRQHRRKGGGGGGKKCSEKKDTAATLKWDLKKNYYCWGESRKGVRSPGRRRGLDGKVWT